MSEIQEIAVQFSSLDLAEDETWAEYAWNEEQSMILFQGRLLGQLISWFPGSWVQVSQDGDSGITVNGREWWPEDCEVQKQAIDLVWKVHDDLVYHDELWAVEDTELMSMREEVETHNSGGIGGPYYPAVNVKVYSFGLDSDDVNWPVVILASIDTSRTMFEGTMEQGKRWVRLNKPERWAMYRASLDGVRFHNSTDRRYLIDHDDTYWHNRERRRR